MISHDHEAIFVHIPKTAGQSVERLFLDELGLSWEQRAPLCLRRNLDASFGPEYLAHMFAHEYLQLGHVTPDQFRRYYKFSIVRNPYDRVLSAYRYGELNQPMSFSEFLGDYVQRTTPKLLRFFAPQHVYLTDSKGLNLMDQVIRFEELDEGILEMTRHVFGEPRRLEQLNAPNKHLDIRREHLPAEDRDLIYRLYRVDFDQFGYHKDD